MPQLQDVKMLWRCSAMMFLGSVRGQRDYASLEELGRWAMRLGDQVLVAALLLGIAGTLARASEAPEPKPANSAGLKTACGVKAKEPGVLRIVLLDEGGSPLPGASVTVLAPHEGVLLASGKTGPDGALALPGLAEKSAYIVGALRGFHSVGAEAYLSSGCDGTLELRLPVFAIICPIEVTAEPPMKSIR